MTSFRWFALGSRMLEKTFTGNLKLRTNEGMFLVYNEALACSKPQYLRNVSNHRGLWPIEPLTSSTGVRFSIAGELHRRIAPARLAPAFRRGAGVDEESPAILNAAIAWGALGVHERYTVDIDLDYLLKWYDLVCFHVSHECSYCACFACFACVWLFLEVKKTHIAVIFLFSARAKTPSPLRTATSRSPKNHSCHLLSNNSSTGKPPDQNSFWGATMHMPKDMHCRSHFFESFQQLLTAFKCWDRSKTELAWAHDLVNISLSIISYEMSYSGLFAAMSSEHIGVFHT